MVKLNKSSRDKSTQYNSEWYKKYYIKNKEKINERCRKYYRENVEKMKKRTRDYYRTEDGNRIRKDYNHKYAIDPINRDCIREKRRRYYRIKRQQFKELIAKTFNKICSNPECLVPGGCTDIRCLQLDHINGDGHKWRYRPNEMILYFLRNPQKVKDELQILCANCNWIKRFEKNEFNYPLTKL